MAIINGLGGVQEPVTNRLNTTRDRKRDEVAAGSTQDDVQISSEAQEAATVGRLVQVAKSSSDVRADRVAAAKQNLEQGTYKDHDVLREVARNLLKYIS